MKKNQKQALAVGAGLAAIAAAATGVYMMTGKNAKNRKKVGKWVSDMQNDIVRELDKAGNVSKATYNKVVDTVSQNYKGLKNVSVSELALAAAELKSSWDSIKAEMDNASTSVRRVIPKTVKSVARKVSVGKAKPAPKQVAKKATKKTAKKTASKSR
jgi:hypothetical protein